ncbi:MAG TPA: CBS domain-containing protein [Gaiellaceae bacterium]|nr:CBS domain-containing protein [Gaiellaceae bacterium]
MNVKQIMSPKVITTRPESLLKDVARTLTEYGISGVPVVDDQGTVVGVVSEADILVKERGPKPRHEGLGAWILRGGVADREKLAARTASEAMTAPAITIAATRSVSEAARLMIDEGIKRLPVVDLQGKLVGIVTRSDLVRVFAREDAEIEREIREDVIRSALWLDPQGIEVRVERGEVTLAGETDYRLDAEILTHLVERVPGVVAVQSTVGWRFDERETKLGEHDPHVPLESQAR